MWEDWIYVGCLFNCLQGSVILKFQYFHYKIFSDQLQPFFQNAIFNPMKMKKQSLAPCEGNVKFHHTELVIFWGFSLLLNVKNLIAKNKCWIGNKISVISSSIVWKNSCPCFLYRGKPIFLVNYFPNVVHSWKRFSS